MSTETNTTHRSWRMAPGSDKLTLPTSQNGIGTARPTACKLAKESGARVLVIDYRLAPSPPFPRRYSTSLWCTSRCFTRLRALYTLLYRPRQLSSQAKAQGPALLSAFFSCSSSFERARWASTAGR